MEGQKGIIAKTNYIRNVYFLSLMAAISCMNSSES